MSATDQKIFDIYSDHKARILASSAQGDAEACMSGVFDLWMFMNRFRNCDLQFYFDEDLHDAIKALNPRLHDRSPLLKPKSKFKIAFIVTNFVDTGGASIPHRFMLEKYEDQDVSFEQYVLVSNLSHKSEYKSTNTYKYMTENVDIKEFEHLPPGMSWLEKGQYIENWITERDIDFVYMAPCPASIYAIASRPALVHSVMSQDCYTFTIGPGAGDFTYMVTTDQVFKYRFQRQAAEKHVKVVMLPLHTGAYIDDAKPLGLSQYGIPDTATVSATTNMWKSCFGDSEVLLDGIAHLIRKHPNYHHIFAGTPRCLDNVEAFLSKNPDVKSNMHFIGEVKNIYRLLKAVDFWVNSFPTSGGSDIEAALVNKPTIEFIANRNLNLHGAEFLRSRECDVFSMEEFIQLAERFITDPQYREDLGRFLNNKITREFDKHSIIKSKIYDVFLQTFDALLTPSAKLPEIGLDDTIEYEKRIALYNAHGRKEWGTLERREFLDDCRKSFPTRPFAWIKALEEAIESRNQVRLEAVHTECSDLLLTDHRINVLLALGYETLEQIDKAEFHAQKALEQAKYDPIPARVAARLFVRNQNTHAALQACQKIPGLETTTDEELKTSLATLPADTFPLYYNY